MIEFFGRYIKPGSPTRAKLSIHLVAQASAQLGETMQDLLSSLGLEKSQETKVKAALLGPELRGDTENLQRRLTDELGLSRDKAAALVAAAKQPEAEPKLNGLRGENGSVEEREPVIITDIRDFRASLQATPGARPVKDLSEYEDLDAKL